MDGVKRLANNEAGDVFIAELVDEFFLHLVLEGVAGGFALELGLDEQRVGDAARDDFLRLRLHILLNHSWGELALGPADCGTQFLLCRDDRGNRFLAELECRKKVGLRDFIGRTLEHDHVRLVADVDEVEVARLHLRVGRVGDELATDTADAHRADRPGERQVADHQRRRGTVDREDVRVVLPVCAEQQGLDLHLVEIPLREQRADWAIGDAAGEDFLLRGPAFALEEPSGETPGCGGLLAVIDREREKVQARTGLGGAAGCDQNDGFPELDGD